MTLSAATLSWASWHARFGDHIHLLIVVDRSQQYLRPPTGKSRGLRPVGFFFGSCCSSVRTEWLAAAGLRKLTRFRCRIEPTSSRISCGSGRSVPFRTQTFSPVPIVIDFGVSRRYSTFGHSLETSHVCSHSCHRLASRLLNERRGYCSMNWVDAVVAVFDHHHSWPL